MAIVRTMTRPPEPGPEWIRSAMDQHQGRLIRFAARITGDLESARDVVQDTFLRLCREKPSDVADHLAAWLFRVCRNRALDVRKKERSLTPLAQRDERRTEGRENPHGVLELDEATRLVLAALDGLPPTQQEVLRLRFLEELSYKEIASITGHSIGNVGFLVHTGIKRPPTDEPVGLVGSCVGHGGGADDRRRVGSEPAARSNGAAGQLRHAAAGRGADPFSHGSARDHDAAFPGDGRDRLRTLGYVERGVPGGFEGGVPGGVVGGIVGGVPASEVPRLPTGPPNTEEYDPIRDNPFVPVAQDPLSTFSIDVDTASYCERAPLPERGPAAAAGRRAHRGAGQLLPLRLRRRPTATRPFAVHVEVGRLPVEARSTGWCASASRAREIADGRAPAGEPGLPDRRLGLDGRSPTSCRCVQGGAASCSSSSCARSDRVAIVVYAGAAGLVLPSTPGERQGDDPRGARPPRGRRLDQRRRGHRSSPTEIADGELHQGRRQPRDPRHRRRLQRRRHRARASWSA